MDENRSLNINWLVRYARETGQGPRALGRYARTLAWLAEWEANPDAGCVRLWHAIVSEGPHDA